MSNKKEKEGKRSLMEYLSAVSELPADALAGEVRVELRGRHQLFVTGCRRILKYSPKQMVLSVKGDVLNILGERMVCTSYYGGTVSIDGNIHSIGFGEETE